LEIEASGAVARHMPDVSRQREVSVLALRQLAQGTNNMIGPSLLGTVLLIVLILILLGAVPTWPHSRNWGYAPSGGVGLVLILVLILVLMRHI